MKTSGTDTKTIRSRDRAAPHGLDGDGEATAWPEGWYAFPEADGAGSVHASARDLAGWLRLHTGDGTVDGRRVVAEKALAQTHCPQIGIDMDEHERGLHPDTTRMGYALGWVVQDHKGLRLVSHSGVVDGFRVQVTLVPAKRLGLAVLANVYRTRLNLALSYTLLDRLLGLKGRDWDAQVRGE